MKDSSFADAQNIAAHLTKSISELDKALSDITISQNKLSSALKKTSDDFEKNAKNIDKNRESIEKLNEEIERTARVVKDSAGSLTYNKDALGKLLTKYETLTTTHANNSRAVRELKLDIVNLSLVIDKQEKELAKSTNTLDLHKKAVDTLSSSFEKIKDKAGEFGPDFADTLESASKGFNAMKDGLAVVKTGFQSVGGAIKTTGFGLLVLVLESVVEYFTKTKEGAEKLRQFLAGVGVVVDTIKKGFTNLGGAIVDAVLHPIESIKSLSKVLVENITNRLASITVIMQGIHDLSFKKVSDGFIQGLTGVTHATDKIAGAYKAVTKIVKDTSAEVVKAAKEQSDNALAQRAQEEKAAEEKKKKNEKARQEKEALRKAFLAQRDAQIAKNKTERAGAEKELKNSQARMAENLLSAFAKEVKDTVNHFAELKTKYAAHKDTVEQLKKEEATALAAIRQKFEEEDAKKLDGYHQKLTQLATEFTSSAKEKALSAIQQETQDKLTQLDEQEKAIRKKRNELEALSLTQLIEGKMKESEETLAAMRREDDYLITAGLTRQAILKDQARKEKEIKDNADKELESKHQEKRQEGIDKARGTGHESSALKQEIELLDRRYKIAIDAANKEHKDTTLIKAKYDKEKADLEDKLLKSRIHAGDKLIDAVMKNTKKDSAVFKAAFLAKKATAIADTIISTKQSIMESLKAYSGIPFIGQALGIAQAAFMAVQGATSIAEIAKQKPAMARGGQFISDGRGAVLPGYSRTDDTNAYLRSGEAVVVSEAMRNPWARNLVSAINVAHGGRDFSVPNGGRGYAIGGIFTDGGNANRYYSAPVNDQKDLANTLAYQMINNFPPIYVDVKDVNNQQNILAQTVNRVTL